MTNNESSIRIINMDASKWRTGHDLYDTILPTLGAPGWHGKNDNALSESMVWGEINAMSPLTSSAFIRQPMCRQTSPKSWNGLRKMLKKAAWPFDR